jgi:hypothetical protein
VIESELPKEFTLMVFPKQKLRTLKIFKNGVE